MTMSRWTFLIGAIAIAVLHTGLYLTLFAQAFTSGEAGIDAPIAGVAVNVLGAPLMFLLMLGPEAFGVFGRWWGDDSNFIIGLAALNGLVWGFATMLLLRRYITRRSHAA